MSESSFLSGCTSGGCGAKIGPGELSGILGKLPAFTDPNLLVGFDASDDAAVYRLNDSQSLISTLDFFSPMVEDPRSFGRIAAANAMSDVWAMGGRPVLALNLVCFPEKMDTAILGEMLAGGAEKIAEAGAVLGGGHSIYDREPKYGLAVTGLVDTAGIIRNNTPRIGDRLILTKPLGVGIVMAAARAELASPEAMARAVASMERLNGYAAARMVGRDISACTDVTGFGLLAHLLEMCGGAPFRELAGGLAGDTGQTPDTRCPENADRRKAEAGRSGQGNHLGGQGVGALLYPDTLPVIPAAVDYANDYLLTAAGQRNRNHVGEAAGVDALPFATQELMFDPQTSGGLLICCAAGEADTLLADIRIDDPAAAIIGEIVPRGVTAITFA